MRGMINKVRIARAYQKMYKKLCPVCRRMLIAKTLEKSRGGQMDPQQVVKATQDILCPSCQMIIVESTRGLLKKC